MLIFSALQIPDFGQFSRIKQSLFQQAMKQITSFFLNSSIIIAALFILIRVILSLLLAI